MQEYLRKGIIAYLVIVILITSFVSMDLHHIDTCNDEDCVICLIIRIAQNNTKIVINAGVLFIIVRFIKCFIDQVRKSIDLFYLSLVKQKVQLNE